MKRIIQTSKMILPLLAVAMLVIPSSDSMAARPAEKVTTVSTVIAPVQGSVVKASPLVTELCLPLNQPSKTKPVAMRTQRPAGQSEAAARLSALGLILGARYALTPSMDVRTADNRVKKYCSN